MVTDGQMQIIQVEVSKIKSRGNIREPTPDDDIPALGKSLLVYQEQPVILDQDYYLIDGWRRWMAAQGAGIKVLWAVITNRKLTASELKVAQFRIAIHRRDVSDYERWKTCDSLLTENPGWAQKDLAAQLGVDAPMVTRLTSPSRCVQEVRDALRTGTLTLSSVYSISKVAEASQLELLAAKLAGETRDQIDQRVRRQKQADKPEVKVGRIRCDLPGGISIILTGQEVGLERFIESMGEAAKLAKKAMADGLNAATFTAVARQKAKATP